MKNDFLPCWEFFDCPEHLRKQCSVYLNFKQGMDFHCGWLFYDTLVGGPAERGPCIYCEITKQKYPEIAELLVD